MRDLLNLVRQSLSETERPEITLDYLKSVYENPETCRRAEQETAGTYLCQRVAAMVWKREGADRVTIYSFNPQHNPDALYFSEDEDDYDGHVFAVVANRFIVDPWLYGVYVDYPKTNTQTVFDLTSAQDADAIAYFYGDPQKWFSEKYDESWNDDDWPV